MKGQLFTQFFLTDGIRTSPEWSAAASKLAAFHDGLDEVFRRFESPQEPNEAATEQDLIRPVLELLGWNDYLPQQAAAGHEDVPDHLLFADALTKTRAVARRNSEDRYQDAVVVQESKRFGLALDQRDRTDGHRAGTPHGQMLRYLTTADIASEGRIRFGILTSGSVWRLYDRRARPRATGFFEADLADLLQPGNEDGLRVFLLLFGRDSFVLQGTATTTFLEVALAEGRRYEESVAQDLSSVVFERVYPCLVGAIAEAAGADNLSEARSVALIFLYRLLFVLYAEDRGLLPVNDARYDDYGLRKRVREDVARRMAEQDTFSATAGHYYNRLTELFRQIDQGDRSIGLPPYNGGLFAPEAAPVLEHIRLPDTVVAEIIYDLSHTAAGGPQHGFRRFVNYRDMSVQQLGSIYERLLEREPTRTADGSIEIRPDSYARKDSGSFYTPQELVDLIVDQTLKPLAEERLRAFEARARDLASDRRSKAERMTVLARLDPAEAVLRLKVLDPAMGSGHFLVTAVDFLSDYIAELIEYVPCVPEWLQGEYESPLVERIAEIRRGILHRAQEGNWIIDVAQLTDQAIIRRMVLKRCIYGVDKNRPDRGAGEGLAVVAQLHRWCAAVVPRPSSEVRRFAGWHPRAGCDSGAGSARWIVCRVGDGRSGGRGRGDGADRGDVRCRCGGGARVGNGVPRRGGDHRRSARVSRLPVRAAVDDGGNEAHRAFAIRDPACRSAQPQPHRRIPDSGARAGLDPLRHRRRRIRSLGNDTRALAGSPGHRAARGIPALGGGLPRRVAGLAEPSARRRL